MRHEHVTESEGFVRMMDPPCDPKRDRPNKLRRLLEYLRSLKEEKFTGHIKINYTQGSIGRVEKFEEVLKE